MLPADGCKTHDSSYGHSFMNACCVGVVRIQAHNDSFEFICAIQIRYYTIRYDR